MGQIDSCFRFPSWGARSANSDIQTTNFQPSRILFSSSFNVGSIASKPYEVIERSMDKQQASSSWSTGTCVNWFVRKRVDRTAVGMGLQRKHNAKRIQFKTTCPFPPSLTEVVSMCCFRDVLTSRKTRVSSRSSRSLDRYSGFSWLEMKME